MAGGSIRARPFDFPRGGRFDPAFTALLVIDLQVDFLSRDGYLAKKGYDTAPLRAIVPAVKRLLDVARAAGCLVVFTRQGHRSDMADLAGFDPRDRKRKPPKNSGIIVRGTPGFEIVPEITVRSGDVIIDKTANGGFTHTEMEPVLRAQGIARLIFTGCTTDVCVHSTMREANDRGFECLLIEDACASGDAYAHAAAVHMVTVEEGIFGAVATTEDAVSGLGSFAPRRRLRGTGL